MTSPVREHVRHDRVAASMKSQQYSCVNRTHTTRNGQNKVSPIMTERRKIRFIQGQIP